MALEQQRGLTYNDYVALPDDGKRYELIDGEIQVTPSPSFRHQRLVNLIYHAIQGFLDSHPLGTVVTAPLDVILGPAQHHTFQPDVLFIANERCSIITEANIQGAPDLVVEVLSEGTAQRDAGPKKWAYQRFGVTEYWIIWQDIPRIEVYRRDEAGRFGSIQLLETGDSLTTPLLPGFRLDLRDLYPPEVLPPAD